jgi:hypothetical protein
MFMKVKISGTHVRQFILYALFVFTILEISTLLQYSWQGQPSVTTTTTIATLTAVTTTTTTVLIIHGIINEAE